MGSDDTTPTTVPPAPPVVGTTPDHLGDGPPPPHVPVATGWTLRWALATVAAVVFGIATLLIFFGDAEWIGVDDYVLAPGSATDTASAVRIEGAESFPPEGEIDFTTVSIRRDVTIWDWFRARSSDTSELVPPEEVDGDRSRDETRQITQFQMDQSQDTAVLVALQYLGYELVPQVEGAFVITLVPESPAAAALRLGDLVVAVDGDPIDESSDLADAISGRSPGDEVTLSIRRHPDGIGGDSDGAAEEEVDIVLAAHPEIDGAGFLGVQIETPVTVDAPFDVVIDVGRVRGPSAGLAFSLAVLDVATPGELTGGNRIATTGTIDRFGNVGQVGGVAQKVAAAKREGVEVFLVPPPEYAVAVEAAGDDIAIACVQTFDDAVIELAENYGGNGIEVALEAGAPAPERSPSPVDPDDGFLTCAEVVGAAL
ncbi:MAG: PDZ domain-containing protein [Acidimicrobiales bacterium]